jgi:hypothetical protein
MFSVQQSREVVEWRVNRGFKDHLLVAREMTQSSENSARIFY